MELGTFNPRPLSGARWSPSEHTGSLIIVKVKQIREGIVTANSPSGTTALDVDLVDLADGEIYRDVLWFSGPVVNRLKDHAGERPLVITFGRRTS